MYATRLATGFGCETECDYVNKLCSDDVTDESVTVLFWEWPITELVLLPLGQRRRRQQQSSFHPTTAAAYHHAHCPGRQCRTTSRDSLSKGSFHSSVKRHQTRILLAESSRVVFDSDALVHAEHPLNHPGPSRT